MRRPERGATVGEWVLEERLGVDAVAELWRARHRFLPEDRPLVRVPTNREGVEAIRAQGLAWHAAAGGPESPKIRGLDPDADPPYLVFEPAARSGIPAPDALQEPVRFVGKVGPPPAAAVLAAAVPCDRPAACAGAGRRLPLLLWPFALPVVLARGLARGLLRCAPVLVPVGGVGLLLAALLVLGGDDVPPPRPVSGAVRVGTAGEDGAEILRELDRLCAEAGRPRLAFLEASAVDRPRAFAGAVRMYLDSLPDRDRDFEAARSGLLRLQGAAARVALSEIARTAADARGSRADRLRRLARALRTVTTEGEEF